MPGLQLGAELIPLPLPLPLHGLYSLKLYDLLVGGTPCQAFSVDGKRLGVDDPRYLWPQVARVIRECDPEWVLIENVPNHLNVGFREVGAELRLMGYSIEGGLFSAAELGASHVRRRMFILGHAKGGGVGRAGGRPRIRWEEKAGGRSGSVLRASDGEKLSLRETFQPGPDQFKAWDKLLEEKGYSHKPAFYDEADELASGVVKSENAGRRSQFHLVGNGVVPLVVAYAFSLLYDKTCSVEHPGK